MCIVRMPSSPLGLDQLLDASSISTYTASRGVRIRNVSKHCRSLVRTLMPAKAAEHNKMLVGLI